MCTYCVHNKASIRGSVNLLDILLTKFIMIININYFLRKRIFFLKKMSKIRILRQKIGHFAITILKYAYKSIHSGLRNV